MAMQIKKIKKRSGELVDFDPSKIENAIVKAFAALGKHEPVAVNNITKKTVKLIWDKFDGNPATVEQVQDIVEMVLMIEGYTDVAKAYILYRHQRAELRKAGVKVPEHVKKLAEES